MIVLVGASACGKTEVAKILFAKYNIGKMVTTTTRKKRVGEIDGKDYFFVSLEEFAKKIQDGAFIEYIEYNNNYYGSTYDQIDENKCIIVEPRGFKKYKELENKNIVTFKLLASEDTRYKRMINRGDKEEDAKARILKDRIEFDDKKIGDVDYTIDTEKYTIEQVADLIYDRYKEVLNR